MPAQLPNLGTAIFASKAMCLIPFPGYDDNACIHFFGDEIEEIEQFATNHVLDHYQSLNIYLCSLQVRYFSRYFQKWYGTFNKIWWSSRVPEV